ncbi:MAG: hypothetical protein ACYC2U_08410 [Candidatus Amoebophilus sp.]
MGTQLQEIIGEFGCTVLNYTKNRIIVDYFYSEKMYNTFLNGINCRAGMGLHNTDEVLQFNKLNDNTLVVVQNEGIETARYKYVTMFKTTMVYKAKNDKGKKVNKTLTFRIRRNEFNGLINLIDSEGNAADFQNLQEAKNYLSERYGANQLTDWSENGG